MTDPEFAEWVRTVVVSEKPPAFAYGKDKTVGDIVKWLDIMQGTSEEFAELRAHAATLPASKPVMDFCK